MMNTRPLLREVIPITEGDSAITAEEASTLEQIALSLRRIEITLSARRDEVDLLESINSSLSGYAVNIILSVFFLLAFGTLALYLFSDQITSIMQVMRDLPLVTR